MATVNEKLMDLRERELNIKAMGGPDKVNTQHEKNKLTARERLDLLFDPGTFREIDMHVRHRSTNFNFQEVEIPADGVVTGHGLIDGRPIFAYSQDFTSRGGSLGEQHAAKIVKIQDLAMKCGVPVIGLNDSGGARVEEGIDALKGYGDIFFRNSRASGVIPQISCIMGPCAGGAVYSPAMTDFILMVKKTSYMFITGPSVIESVTGEKTTFEELGGAVVHNAKSGNAHFACEDDKDAIEKIRELISFLPNNNMEEPEEHHPHDDPHRDCDILNTIIPDEAMVPYDMKTVIEEVLDDNYFFEVQELFAENAIIGYGRLDGKVVGIIANQPMFLAGCLDINASDKITRFIRTCDAYNIPLLTFVDVPGFLPGVDQEHNGIIRHGAKMLWAYSEATVPKLTVVTRKNYGGSYIAMSSAHLGADMVFAWPSSEIAVMGAKGAVGIIASYRKAISSASEGDKQAVIDQKIAEYEAAFNTPYIAAERGYVDAVIEPRETRKRLVDALNILKTKREVLPAKKHGNIPL
jgi:methylmalonyl-CoA decarboxylase subunit alpha